MKTRRLLALAALVAALVAPLSAATITLANGKALENARVTGQTARFVTVFHSGGILQVEKELLPADLRAQYPLDGDAASAEAAKERAELAARAAAEEARRRALAAKPTAPKTETAAATSTAATPNNPDTGRHSPKATGQTTYYVDETGQTVKKVTPTKINVLVPLDQVK